MNCPQGSDAYISEVLASHPEPASAAPQAVEGLPADATLALGESTPAPSPKPVVELEKKEWRDELSARLNRYRARRTMRPPRYPSLQLRFDADEAQFQSSASFEPTFEPVSDRALALDVVKDMPIAADADAPAMEPMPVEATPLVENPPGARSTAKILEFPRFAWGPPPPPDDQLAEPVMDRPRILEVPEAAPLPPALGGITMDAVERQEAEKRPGIDIPLQSASVARRILACGIDGLIVLIASALFAFIFWKVTAVRPPLPQILGVGVGIPCLFWAAYQYLLIVYAATTPGLRVSRLALARFDGTSANRSVRRWRVLASFLSAASLGMGYAWLFLDEDALCWHDRITHTYLARK